MKENNYPNYYTMTVARSEDCVMILSEKVDSVLEGFTFESLSAAAMVSLDHRTLEVNRIEYKQCVDVKDQVEQVIAKN